jgi:hypothetical protein
MLKVSKSVNCNTKAIDLRLEFELFTFCFPIPVINVPIQAIAESFTFTTLELISHIYPFFLINSFKNVCLCGFFLLSEAFHPPLTQK